MSQTEKINLDFIEIILLLFRNFRSK